MGFYWLGKAKDEDQKVLNNTEMALAIKESTEKMITSMIGDALVLNGTSLEEIPAEYVLMYNKYVKQYNEMFAVYLKWAAGQDKKDEKIQKQLDRQYELLLRIEKKLDKKGGDRS